MKKLNRRHFWHRGLGLLFAMELAALSVFSFADTAYAAEKPRNEMVSEISGEADAVGEDSTDAAEQEVPSEINAEDAAGSDQTAGEGMDSPQEAVDTEEALETEAEALETENKAGMADEADESEKQQAEELQEKERKYESLNDEYEDMAKAFEAAYGSHKLTEEELFMLAPDYLNKTTYQNMERYLEKCVDLTEDALDDVSKVEEWSAIFIKGLKDGKSILLKETLAAAGQTTTSYDDYKKELAAALVREYLSQETNLSDKVGELSKGISSIEQFYDLSSSVEKEAFINAIYNAISRNGTHRGRHLEKKDVKDLVDAMYEDTDLVFEIAGNTMDALGLMTEIIELQEIELEVIDDLMAALSDRTDTDLWQGLYLLREDIVGGVVQYTFTHYVHKEALGTILKSMAKYAIEAKGIKLAASASCLVEVTIAITAKIYESYKPSVNDIVNTTVMHSYFLLLQGTVCRYQTKFYRKEGDAYDIEIYKAAYQAELCAIKLMMGYAKKLADTKALKNSLDLWREGIGQAITVAAYLELCLSEADAAIANGQLVISRDKKTVTKKTSDGTVIDSSYDSKESISAKFNAVMQQFPAGSVWTGSWNGTTQCFGFARMVFSKIFGCEMPSCYLGNARYKYANENNVSLIGQLSGNGVNSASVQSLMAQGKTGDVIQASGAKYGQHTMVFAALEEDGVRVYDCNAHLSQEEPDCMIHYWVVKYSTFADWYGTGSDATGENGISLYRALNYGEIYGDGSNLFYDDSVNFVISDGVLTKYNGQQQFVVIPDGVTSIGKEAFKNNKTIVSVTIPEGITSIGNGAFNGCTKLIGVIMPDSVTEVGDSAFNGCSSLSYVTFSEALEKIGNNAFEKCVSLREVKLPDSVITVGFDVFSGCTSLEAVRLSKNLSRLGESAFYDCDKLTAIEIPKSLEETITWNDSVDGP
ncbi:MAG: leucine-rich repeat protein, partial [Lachnospiraceae bacterium]|nr:leucine-rich repeat protein [Lachnospiraceae bacterium]